MLKQQASSPASTPPAQPLSITDMVAHPPPVFFSALYMEWKLGREATRRAH
jgi:hypothetical protein